MFDQREKKNYYPSSAHHFVTSPFLGREQLQNSSATSGILIYSFVILIYFCRTEHSNNGGQRCTGILTLALGRTSFPALLSVSNLHPVSLTFSSHSSVWPILFSLCLSQAPFDLGSVTHSMKSFVDKISSHEGAEFPWYEPTGLHILPFTGKHVRK